MFIKLNKNRKIITYFNTYNFEKDKPIEIKDPRDKKHFLNFAERLGITDCIFNTKEELYKQDEVIPKGVLKEDKEDPKEDPKFKRKNKENEVK